MNVCTSSDWPNRDVCSSLSNTHIITDFKNRDYFLAEWRNPKLHEVRTNKNSSHTYGTSACQTRLRVTERVVHCQWGQRRIWSYSLYLILWIHWYCKCDVLPKICTHMALPEAVLQENWITHLRNAILHSKAPIMPPRWK